MTIQYTLDELKQLMGRENDPDLQIVSEMKSHKFDFNKEDRTLTAEKSSLNWEDELWLFQKGVFRDSEIKNTDILNYLSRTDYQKIPQERRLRIINLLLGDLRQERDVHIPFYMFYSVIPNLWDDVDEDRMIELYNNLLNDPNSNFALDIGALPLYPYEKALFRYRWYSTF